MPSDEAIRLHQVRLSWTAASLAKATGERIEEIMVARAAGLTFDQIGDGLGISGEAAGNLYRRNKTKTKGAAQ